MNKHSDKKLKSGRGTVGKTPVVGAKDRATNKVIAMPITNPDKPTLHRFINTHIGTGIQIYTDEALAYKGLTNHPHQAVKHSQGQYVDGDAHTNGIESLWSMLKRGIIGVYHHVSDKHLHRYTAEFSGRHGDRTEDTMAQVKGVINGMHGKRLRYEDLVAWKRRPSVSTEKRKKRPRGRPPESEEVNFIPLPASFDEILQAVVRTRTPEEIEQMLAEERDENRRRDKSTES